MSKPFQSKQSKIWLSILSALCLVVWFGWFLIDSTKVYKQYVREYIDKYKCVRTGFAGRNATPTYVCTTGYILETEMPELMREEKDQ